MKGLEPHVSTYQTKMAEEKWSIIKFQKGILQLVEGST